MALHTDWCALPMQNKILSHCCIVPQQHPAHTIDKYEPKLTIKFKLHQINEKSWGNFQSIMILSLYVSICGRPNIANLGLFLCMQVSKATDQDDENYIQICTRHG